VGAGHFAHKQDDRHHHQPGRDDCRATADGIGKRLPHHPAASGDEDEEKRPQQFGEQPAPLLLRIGEVHERVDQRLLVRLEKMLARGTHHDDFYLSVGACDSMNDQASGSHGVTLRREPHAVNRDTESGRPVSMGLRRFWQNEAKYSERASRDLD
jgi:hypothetical protein